MPVNYRPEKTGKDIQVYKSQIEYLTDEYIDSLHDKNDIYNDRVFTGLIVNIADVCRFNKDIQTYDSIDFVWNIWKEYRSLCYRYKQDVNIQEFAILLNINQDTLYSWAKDETRKGDMCHELSCSRSETIRKMQDECKMGRYKGALRGNVGAIFLCKAVDHLVETAPAPIQEIDKHEKMSLEASKKEFEAFQIEKKD